jgi:hypothetical protein
LWGDTCRFVGRDRPTMQDRQQRIEWREGVEQVGPACRWPCAAPQAANDSRRAVVDNANHRATSLACWPPHWTCRPHPWRTRALGLLPATERHRSTVSLTVSTLRPASAWRAYFQNPSRAPPGAVSHSSSPFRTSSHQA